MWPRDERSRTTRSTGTARSRSGKKASRCDVYHRPSLPATPLPLDHLRPAVPRHNHQLRGSAGARDPRAHAAARAELVGGAVRRRRVVVQPGIRIRLSVRGTVARSRGCTARLRHGRRRVEPGRDRPRVRPDNRGILGGPGPAGARGVREFPRGCQNGRRVVPKRRARARHGYFQRRHEHGRDRHAPRRSLDRADVGLALGVYRHGLDRFLVVVCLARALPLPARRRAPGRARRAACALDPPARCAADVGDRRRQDAGRPDLVVLSVLAAQVSRREVRHQAGARRLALDRRLSRGRRWLDRRWLVVEQVDHAGVDSEPGAQDGDAPHGGRHNTHRTGASRWQHVDRRGDRQRRRGGAPGLVGEHVYARERHVPPLRGGIDLGHRRVRGRHGRRCVPARHGQDSGRHRQRLHPHFRRVRFRVRDRLDHPPRPRAATRARSVEGDTMIPALTLILALQTSGPNALTAPERAAGWRLLFDGRTFAGWRGLGYDTVPTGHWVVVDGTIKKIANGNVPRVADGRPHNGGDLMTVDTFGDFELTWEWKVTPSANSGVKYNVSEEMSIAQNGTMTPTAVARGEIAPNHSALGFEYQMLDDDRHEDGKLPTHRSGALYDLIAPSAAKRLRPVGEWNRSTIIFRGNHGEHWLNGQKIVEYNLGTAHMDSLLAKSKYRSIPGFGDRRRGHIVLQDHGDEVYFRELKVRPL